ncbi:MAG: dynein heavy chain 8 [Monoraphidium minutum]|nr:MAG: dynein heavy chain 8 [Monoraphidium minutum]
MDAALAAPGGLAAYLELKRLAFPRFFFLSNDEMLEILSETKDASRVQPHLKKCFEGIERLRFEPNGDISGMASVEGEVVPLSTHIRPAAANGAVEKWLVQVEAGMVDSMRRVVVRGVEAYAAAARGEWVLQWPGQVVLAVTAIYWTQDVASAIAAGASDASALPACAARCGRQLGEVVELVRGELSPLNRATLSALVVMDVHARDVAAALAAEEGVAGSPGCFAWTSQLRTYFEERPADEAPPPRRASAADPPPPPEGGPRIVMLRMMNAQVEYGYEYLGNSMRLVVTPLTDRCYRTLIGAIHLNMGGAPEGPAGTGKTETTKDLAKALARQCVVFNCSDTLDYATMGKFFKGLASAGAWACFDEFNRIDLEVLSVVAQQVSELQAAVRGRLKTFVFEGTELRLRPSCNVFITMNPGYAGRSELPDNLKTLFRTVAMMVPDYALIAEIMLYSSGYMKARECARKIVATYRLCSEQLSSQDHYDYGMRAVMAVLRAAGNLKRRFPGQDEAALALRAIVDVNLCKFLAHDVPLFNGILSDLFPGVELPPPDYAALHAALGRQCAARGLQATEYFTLKATQLYEMVVVRHGLMLVGEAMSGKTSALQCLAGALGELKDAGVEGPLFQRVVSRTINPKAVTMGQLYGEADKATQEWKDGVLAVAFRALASDPSPDRKWLVLDGPVDALWIENMNTVLDDNRKLCLPNSEIITMSPTMSMIFEVVDLLVASPATVSRCGMVYLEPHQLGWRPLVTSWLQALPKALGTKARRQLKGLLEWLLPPCLGFVRKRVKELSPTSDASLARAAMRIVGGLLGARPCGGGGGGGGGEGEAAEPDAAAGGAGGGGGPLAALGVDDAGRCRLAEAALLFGLAWGVGGSADEKGRQEFDAFFRLLIAGGAPAGFDDLLPPKPPGLAHAPPMPDEGSIYDFVWDPKAAGGGRGAGAWVQWSAVTPALAIPQGAAFGDIIVPTIDTARYSFLFDLSLRQRYPLLLIGPTGTGKTTLVMRHLLGGGGGGGASSGGGGGGGAGGQAGEGGEDEEGSAHDSGGGSGGLVGGLAAGKWVPVFLTLSARTTAGMTQEQVDGRLDKRRRGVYGPPIGKRAVVFVDDLNMPSKEVFGAQPPLELLRQALDAGGWYGRDNVWRAMADVQWAAAMGPPGGGRAAVSGRVLRHFSTLACTQASDDTLMRIFGSILSWHLSKRGFPESLAPLAGPLVAATRDVYAAAAAKLLPTPAKSHYVFNLRDMARVVQSHYLFNLRDMARVVQGIMMLPPSALPKAPSDAPDAPAPAAAAGGGAAAPVPCTPAARALKRLWVHETLRVFYDRLVDGRDREWLLEQLRGSCRVRLGEDAGALLGHLAGGGGGGVGQEELRRLFFGDFADASSDPLERAYCELSDAAALSAVEAALTDLNAQSRRPLPLAVFLFAVEHVSRVCRVLKQPGGNMLLVGVGGSGRQSVARLAAHIAGLEVFQVEVGKSYGRAEWREDLKACCRRAGAEGKRLAFLMSDGQLKEEAWLEDIGQLLNGGEVPNMFPQDERIAILEAVRPAAAKRGLETPLELWSYFVSQTRANLHLLLALSPAGSAFRERLRASPALVDCCTIDWFWQWPADALEAVALKELRQLDMDAGTRRKLVGICQAVHDQVSEASAQFLSETGRHNYVTPSSYLELLAALRALLEAARAESARQQKRYSVGLEKLAGSALQVEAMQAELVALQPQLVATVAEVEGLMGRIAHDKKHEVEPKAAVVAEEEARARSAAAAAKAIKDECEADLAEAIPILNDALAALDTIKEADIAYMRKLANPPGAIKLVLEAVCVVLDVKPVKAKDEAGKEVKDYWKPSVALLNDREFLSKLKAYDKDNIPPRIVAAIRGTYIPDEGFTSELAKRASPAAEGLCKWVHAMSSYDKVAKVVAPKRAKLAEAEATYEGVMAGLRDKQAELQALLDRLAGMEADLKANTERKERLEGEIELCSVKLERAAALMGGLGCERTRWQDAAAALAKAKECLTGDMLVAAAAVAYLGAFTAPWRARLVAGALALCAAQGIPASPAFSLAAALGSPLATRGWLIAGLPNDAFSIENAIIVSKARRWPLMIDPQGQANKWVRNMERPKNLQVLNPGRGSDFMRALENAVQFGRPVLLEDVGEELDPALEPLLSKQVFKQGGVTCIRLGDAAVELSPDFRLYLTTKLRNPHYLPETAVKVTLLNFTITPGGLSDQLLGVLVAAERPDLEEQKAALVVSGAENKRQLLEIEDRILEVLSASTGNILEDETAVGVITAAKALGNDVAAKQAAAEETEAAIDGARAAYAPAGAHASALFFCISDLAAVDPMYQYSLPWFTTLLLGAARDAARGGDVPARLAAVQNQFTLSLYRNVCRSLFEKDKLLFAFLLAARLMAAAGDLDGGEWRFFLTGGAGQPRGDAPNPAPTWLPDRAWRQLRHLAGLPTFMGLDAAVADRPDDWKGVYDAAAPEAAALPGLFAGLDAFRRICVLRCLRPDKVLPAAQLLVEARLGRAFVEPPPFDLAACYADSGPAAPLIFVLSPGSDPGAALAQFAAERGMGGRMAAISLGQGQGAKAAALIADAAAAGSWVVLQNCHLAPSWMPDLEKICEDLGPDTTNPAFRLHAQYRWFPVNILQNGVKMTNEPPKGLRANMRRSLAQEPLASEAFFEGCRRPAAFKRLACGLVFFHALVQERRSFGPLGWNIPYGFDDGDQRISLRQLRMYLDESAPPGLLGDGPGGADSCEGGGGGALSAGVPFAALRYAIGECNYGGRVTDDKDRVLLATLLDRCLCPGLVDDPSSHAPCDPAPAGAVYAPPGGGGRADYAAWVDGLPSAAHPGVYGLHGNAEIARDVAATDAMLASLLAMGDGGGCSDSGGGEGGAAGASGEAGSGGGGGGRPEDGRLAGLVAECLAALPAAPFDTDAAATRFPVCYEESMNAVLVQEMARFNRLTGVLRESLAAMGLALAGLAVMSGELEAAARSISLNQVPELWRRVSYPSLQPLASYMADLRARLDMLSDWAAAGRPPPSFCLPRFFFPHSFLTAGLQNFARRRKLPIDVVVYDFEPLPPTAGDAGGPPAPPGAAPPEGVYVHGLWLEGARWDGAAGALAECAPRVLYAPAPVLWFRPRPAAEIVDAVPRYACPLYCTAERRGVLATTGHSTNFVLSVKLPAGGAPPGHWTVRGAALLAQLSD